MSDEEESMSEGFSASEEEWKPNKEARGGESSDDDDSDFEESPLAAVAESSVGSASKKKAGEPKARSAAKQTVSKKRAGLSLRAKLYNKYRPLPKTFSPPSSIGKNSPSASTSRTNPKNAKTPNESGGKHQANDDDDSTSEGSIDDYLVNPEELDFQSSFFNADSKMISGKSSVTPVPDFDCNAGLGNLSDSESEDGDNNDPSNFRKEEDAKAFDFRDLLANANSLERAKEAIAKRAAADATTKKNGTSSKSLESKVDTMDVYSLLALGEKQNHRSHNEGEDEDDDDEEDDEDVTKTSDIKVRGPSKLSKTKSTRVKRHTKTRPASTVVAGGDTDDSEFEEVADSSNCADTTHTTDVSNVGNLEIHVELPSRHREKKTKTQQDIENALKRKLNREIKDRQLLMHKASLLCLFGRSYFYNRLLNDTILMQTALTLLPSMNAYPPERGTEIKYYQSLVTWFKSAVTLKSQNLYSEKKIGKSKSKLCKRLKSQIEKREAKCKQDMVFIFVILLRGMGIQCRLIVNMQPLPLKPAQSDLLTIKLKQDEENCVINNPSNKKKQSQNEVHDETPRSSTGKTTNSKTKEIKIENVKEETETLKIHDSLETTPPKNVKKSIAKNKQERIIPGEEEPELKHRPKKSQDETSNLTKQSPKISSQSAAKGDTPITHSAQIQNQNSNLKNKPTQKKKKAENEQQSQKTKTERQGVIKPLTPDEVKDDKPACSDRSKKGRNVKRVNTAKSSPTSSKEVHLQEEKVQYENKEVKLNNAGSSQTDELDNSQKENVKRPTRKPPALSRLKRNKPMEETEHQVMKKTNIGSGSIIIPKIVLKNVKEKSPMSTDVKKKATASTRNTRSRSRSISPQFQISTEFLETKKYKEKFPSIVPRSTKITKNAARSKGSSNNKIKISAEFLKNTEGTKRALRSAQKTNVVDPKESNSENKLNSEHLEIPQMDGAEDEVPKNLKSKKQKLQKKKKTVADSEEEFEPSPTKRPKLAPSPLKRDLRVVSTDNEENTDRGKRKPTAGDMWVEVWSDLEEEWVCVDLFKGKIYCVDTIRKSASSNLAYVFAFQNDLSLKDVTARYCPHWTTVVRKARIDKAWLDTAIRSYLGQRTRRDIKEDQELRRIHEEKPMPTAISDYKNHPFYALERHLLKFEAIYPPDAPALGYIRKEAVYSRDCIHTLHSREIWLKQARVVKLGEKPYKIVKARPKWDRITQTVIKDQPLEIFGYWQTQEYDPPTAENGIVPRNAYGNVELFKPTMLPKKCVHIRLPGLNRICKKLGIDCANAVVGFDFHQGSCHPTYDGFVVCEEFGDQVTAAWYQDQENQELKEQEKYEARVYGNWKKLIRGLQIRERLKLKYNF